MVIWIKCYTLWYLFYLSSTLVFFYIYVFIPKDCGLPTSLGNGTIELTDAGTTTYGAFATQSCNFGFDLDGVVNINCGADGNWSDPDVMCIIKGNLYLLEVICQPMHIEQNKDCA